MVAPTCTCRLLAKSVPTSATRRSVGVKSRPRSTEKAALAIARVPYGNPKMSDGGPKREFSAKPVA